MHQTELTDFNYSATPVVIKELKPIPGADLIQQARVLDYWVIVSINTKVGDFGLYFPIESQISEFFLSQNNLYSNVKNNVDPNKKGFFGNQGRVRAITLRKTRSEGFFAPASELATIGIDVATLPFGESFNVIDGELLCQKYVPPMLKERVITDKRISKRVAVSPFFRFHSDTPQFKRAFNSIPVGSQLILTEKFHGTNATFANLPIQNKLTWIEKIAKFFGARIEETHYQKIAASRRVIKVIDDKIQDGRGFYESNVWNTIYEQPKDRIPQGYTLYGEIVGYAGDKRIQPGYDYGHKPGECSFWLFHATRIEDGKTVDLSHTDTSYLAHILEIPYVPTISYIYHFNEDEDRTKEVLSQVEYFTANPEFCDRQLGYNVLREGVVVRVDYNDSVQFFKSKSYKFLEQETKNLDSDVVSIEDEEAQGE